MTLDLTPSLGSGAGVNVLHGVGSGDEIFANEVGESGSKGQVGGHFATAVTKEGTSRTREYEETVNREFLRRRQEAEKAAAAAAAKDAGFILDRKKIEKNESFEGTVFRVKLNEKRLFIFCFSKT